MQRPRKSLIRALILPWMSFSLLSCSSGVERPDAQLCVLNAVDHQLRCYNVKDDYTAAGKLRIDAKPVVREVLGLEDLHRMTCVDPDGLAEIKRYILELREKSELQP